MSRNFPRKRFFQNKKISKNYETKNRKEEKVQDFGKKRNYFLKEPDEHFKKLEIKGFIDETPILAMFDTGAIASFIAHSEVLKRNLKVNIGSGRVLLANGQTTETYVWTKFYLKFRQHPSTEFIVNASILKGMTEKLVLGLDFMKGKDTVLNLKERTISLEDHSLDMKVCKKEVAVLDEELIAKFN